jgi:predicted permease
VLFRDPNTPLSRPTDLDFVIPLEMSVQQAQSRVGGSTIIARLAEGISIAQAQAEVDSVLRAVAEENPDRNGGISARVVPLRDVAFGRYRTSVLLLQAAVILVLIVGCANIAGLLLARNRGRRGELAIRLALGAERTRVVRQLIGEALPLSAIGGALGVFVAWGGLELSAALAPGHFSQLGDVSLDWRVLAFTSAMVIVTTLLFATIPAAQALKVDLVEPLKQGGRRSIGGARRQRGRGLLVGSQVAFATVLLIGAGLLLSSLVHVVRAELGAQPDGLITFDFRLAQRETVMPLPSQYRGMGLVRINTRPALTVERVLERVQSMPTVTGVAAASNPPLGGFGLPLPFLIEGVEQPATDNDVPGMQTGPLATYTAVAGDYFAVMKIALKEGRFFDDRDSADRAPVVIINEALARRFFNGTSPLGRRLTVTFVPDDVPREIVGVVGDTAIGPLERERAPAIYLPHVQQSALWAGPAWGARAGMYFVVRTHEGLQTFTPALARAVAEVDSSTPVADVQPVAQAVRNQLQDLQLTVLLVGVFSVVAVVLTAIGIYGVIALAIADRTREIALRRAVGARSPQIVKMVLTDVAWFVGTGLAAGLLLSLAVSRLLGGALYGVTPMDPMTYVAVSVLFIAIAIGACLVPARRAVAIDAMTALRAD